MNNSQISGKQLVKPTTGFEKWVLYHDENLWFNVFYIGLAVVLSIWLGLFWLVAVVSTHAIIEYYNQYLRNRDAKLALGETLWEIKLDVGLVVFAFWLAIYLDFIFGIAGLAAGGRAVAQAGSRAAQTGTRVAAWQRTIRGVFITLDDVGLAFKAFAKKKNKKKNENKTEETSNVEIQNEVEQEHINNKNGKEVSSWFNKKYTFGDWFALGFLFLPIFTILMAPWITGMSFYEIWSIVLEEMHPFPA